MMTEEIDLTEEQDTVVNFGPASHVLVTASAGTGKTHVLVHRLARLVNQENLAPGSEILLLTFTRAASGELRNRVSRMGGDVAFVSAMTFDSFATRQLHDSDPEGSWSNKSYDGRIEEFTDKLSNTNSQLGLLKSRIKHIFVDEIQDLVGVRANMVKALLMNIDCGFTLFGDPAQGIYNFQETGEAKRIGSLAFYKWLEDEFVNLNKITLTKNFRAKTESAKTALWAHKELMASSPDYNAIYTALKRQLDYDVERAVTFPILATFAGRTGILTRTNFEALKISEQLHEKGISHALRIRNNPEGIQAWLGALLFSIQSNMLRRDTFEKRFSELNGLDAIDIPKMQDAWQMLTRLSPGTNNIIDLNQVYSRVLRHRVPDDLTHNMESNLIISTIHRAKGLEFDNVVVVYPDETGGLTQDDDYLGIPEETRILFVAMTRPTDSLFKGDISLKNEGGWWFTDKRLKRLVKASWPKQKSPGSKRFASRTTVGIEVRSSDVDEDVPAMDNRGDGLSPVETQSFLCSEVAFGDEVNLVLTTSAVNSMKCYGIIHNKSNTLLGFTNKDFTYELLKRLKDMAELKHTFNRRQGIMQPPQWPISIQGLRVESVDSVAGNKAIDFPEGFGTTGIWNRVRIMGLGTVKYEKPNVSER